MFIMVAAGWKLYFVAFMIHGCSELSLSLSLPPWKMKGKLPVAFRMIFHNILWFYRIRSSRP